MDDNVTLIMTPDPDWTHGEQLQLLRLLFAPRRHHAQRPNPAGDELDEIYSQVDGQQSPDKE